MSNENFDPSKVSTEELSGMLDREISSKNLSTNILNKVSKFKHPIAHFLLNCNLKDVSFGDVLRMYSYTEILQKEQNTRTISMKYSIQNEDNRLMPMSPETAEDLMLPYYAQLEKGDNLKDMLKDLKKNLNKFLSEKEIKKIFLALDKSYDRLINQDIRIIGVDESSIGNVLEYSKKELEDMDLYFTGIEDDEDFVQVEETNDDLDIIALKELLLILKGNPVRETSIGLGFFGKFLPELKQEGVDSVIFKVEDNLLKEIKLEKFDTKGMGDTSILEGLCYAPVSAAFALTQAYSEVEKQSRTFEDMDGNPMVFEQNSIQIDRDFIKDNQKYYVLADGAVATAEKPEDNLVREFIDKKYINNRKASRAAEVFLFEKREILVEPEKNGLDPEQDKEPEPEFKEIYNSTRLYFVPYKPTELHLIHQDGRVVFGNNDASLNSCSFRKESLSQDEILDFMEVDNELNRNFRSYDYKNLSTVPYSFSGGFISRIVYINREIEKEKQIGPQEMALNYEEDFEQCLKSISGENLYTIDYEIKKYNLYSWLFQDSDAIAFVKELLSNYGDISTKYFFPLYFDKGELSVEKKVSYFQKIGIDYHHEIEFNKVVETSKFINNFNKKYESILKSLRLKDKDDV